MTIDYQKLATALETVADYVDATEGRRLRDKHAALQTRIASFAERYEESTGEAMPASLHNKLASLDEDALEHVLRISKTAGGSPESLGDPDTTETKTAGAEEDHVDRFTRWILS
jgi:hypothetical protein